MKDFKSSIALVIFLIFFAALWVVFIKLGVPTEKYDERQEINRGKAYKTAFFTICIWEAVYLFSKLCDIRLPVEDDLMTLAGILAGICAYAAYCILTDAYFPINRSSSAIIAVWLVIAAMNIFIGIQNIIDGSIITDGRLNFRAAGILCSIVLFVLAVMCIVRKSLFKRREAED
ncbi:MAG: hypothetical protein NC223_03865 [Butyrivibrio sp.]|nr:hypothetical protein [Butyrivibrio sp.]